MVLFARVGIVHAFVGAGWMLVSVGGVLDCVAGRFGCW